MSFLKKILKKKEKATAEKPVKKDRESPRVAEPAKTEEKMPIKGKMVLGVIRSPHLTEKTTAAAELNKYIFSVAPRANKVATKRAIEARYGVKVISVNILNTQAKERRRGKQIGWKPGFKKAIVTIKEGQTIEIQ